MQRYIRSLDICYNWMYIHHQWLLLLKQWGFPSIPPASFHACSQFSFRESPILQKRFEDVSRVEKDFLPLTDYSLSMEKGYLWVQVDSMMFIHWCSSIFSLLGKMPVFCLFPSYTMFYLSFKRGGVCGVSRPCTLICRSWLPREMKEKWNEYKKNKWRYLEKGIPPVLLGQYSLLPYYRPLFH